jgi:hypothetical protein
VQSQNQLRDYFCLLTHICHLPTLRYVCELQYEWPFVGSVISRFNISNWRIDFLITCSRYLIWNNEQVAVVTSFFAANTLVFFLNSKTSVYVKTTVYSLVNDVSLLHNKSFCNMPLSDTDFHLTFQPFCTSNYRCKIPS